MTGPATVAVVGAGFSGLLTTLRLLLDPEGPRVILCERGPRFGRGAAYATGNPSHLLNVRAANMSALVEQPSHFIDWLAAEGVPPAERWFVTRESYGRYLQSLLREAAAETGSGRLRLEHDAVSGLERDGEGWRVRLAMGRVLVADAVVLALGNLSPPPLAAMTPGLIASPRYVADPWRWDGPAGDGDILLIGSGLTAIDVALTVRAAAPRARLTALSRHGLLPRAHGETGPAPAGGAPEGSPAAVLAEVRRRAAGDWRAAIDALRPHVHGLWRGWSVAERRRFLRHLRPWWSVVRHRLAPQVAEAVEAMRASDALTVAAGDIHRLDAGPEGVALTWSARGQRELRTARFAQVVNCTGPRGDLRRSGEPLIGALLDAGLARPDDCELGIDVDRRSRVIGASGEPTEGLYAVGPLTRGQFYEITAVPDIRLQAADCADAILNSLALKALPAAAREGAGGERLADELADFVEAAIAELDVELGSLKFARRLRNAWELRGRRAALAEVAQWLDERRGGGGRG